MRAAFVPLLLLCWLVPSRPAEAANPTTATLGDTTLAYRNGQTWFSRDKGYHFALSAGASVAVYGIARELGMKEVPAALMTAVVVGTAGVLREVVTRDEGWQVTGGELSRKDLFWDGAGIVVGVSLTELVFRRRFEQTPALPVP